MNYITNGVFAITGRHVYQKGVAPNGSSWVNAPVAISAQYATDNTLRAGISFENQGSNAGYLYLDTDGKLKLADNTGVIHTITMT